jgi:hypothetical protein
MENKRSPEPVKLYGNKALISGTEFDKFVNNLSQVSTDLKDLTKTVKEQGVKLNNLDEIVLSRFKNIDESLAELNNKITLLAKAMTDYIGG